MKKLANGVACDVWVGKKKYNGKDIVIEWYFLANTWQSFFADTFIDETKTIPIMTLVFEEVMFAGQPVFI